MVKIAIAGATGNVAREIMDALLVSKRHEIIALSRREPASAESDPSITWTKTDYANVDELTSILNGVHVVLSFVAPFFDQDEAFTTQKNLIDASIRAGVKRFAPSEFVAASFEHLSWYAYKGRTRTYLASVNTPTKVLEYTLFQPGLFTNYLAQPHKTATHLKQIDVPWDFGNRRLLIREGAEEARMTLTTVQDVARVVAEAVEFKGEWPIVGGIAGSTLTMREIVGLGEEIRGDAFTVEQLPVEALKNGIMTPSWLPSIEHGSIPPEHVEATSKVIVAGLLLAVGDAAFESNGEWNKLLPEYKFTDARTFLTKAWQGNA